MSLLLYCPPGLTKRVDYPARASRNPLRDRRTQPRHHSSADSWFSHALALPSPLTGPRVTGILSPILLYGSHAPTHGRPRREAMSIRFRDFRPIELFAKAGQHVLGEILGETGSAFKPKEPFVAQVIRCLSLTYDGHVLDAYSAFPIDMDGPVAVSCDETRR